jgi:hypothetical protein
MKKALKIVVIAAAVGFAAAQAIRPDQANPPVDPAATLEASTAVPPEVKAVLERSCRDCHTNRTDYPWYAQVSPFSWFLDGHIRDGRAEMNFSTWAEYSSSSKENKLDEICEQVSGGNMPLPSYLWIHRDAALSDSEKTLLCEWSKAEIERLSQ